jgi:hypothetical protein
MKIVESFLEEESIKQEKYLKEMLDQKNDNYER